MGQFLLLNFLVPGEWKAIKVTGVHNSMIVIKMAVMPYLDSSLTVILIQLVINSFGLQ